MEIAVTTASGQLGAAIIRALIKEIGSGKAVGLARSPEKASHLGIEIRKGDYNSREELTQSLSGIDTVLLVSGMDAPDKRIIQHRNVIDAAKANSVKKIVYTSIIGKDGTSTFDAIVKTNRQTEEDIKNSGMDWVIGRNGLYIEPDIEYIETYKKEGKISNCAGVGKCSYVSRDELGYAYGQMLLNDDRNGKIFNLAGKAITQQELTDHLNNAFNTSLKYESVSPDDYLEFQKNVNGEFLGTIIAGIYTKILNGEFEIASDFKEAAGREHISWKEYFNRII